MVQELTKQIMVRLSEDDHAEIKRWADSEDRDVSYWVRRAVRRELSRAREQNGPAPDPAVWDCKIGRIARARLPMGADGPLRDAVEKVYKDLTGEDPEFVFSGWGGRLTGSELACVENRLDRYIIDGEF